MKKIIVIFIVIAITIAFFISNYGRMIESLKQEALSEQDDIKVHIQISVQLIDDLILHGEIYLSHSNISNSEFYNLLAYNSKTNSYNLNAVQNTPKESFVGNLNGIGKIPTEGIYKDEINLALEYNTFFKSYRTKYPNIDWIYYVSQNNFINAYPWAQLKDVAFSEDFKTRDSYKIATPEKNPIRDRVWTHVYTVGAETMVTLSKPLYANDKFMGVVSINITNKMLSDSINSKNNFYLFDDSNTVLATNDTAITKNKKLNEYTGLTDYNIKSLLNVEKGVVKEFGNYYVYVVRCEDAPWNMVIMVPMWQVFSKAFLYTLPFVIIGILIVLAYYEISKRKQSEEELLFQAIRDYLTGVYNRRFFIEMLRRTMVSANRTQQKVSLLMVDIDFFKKVNDTLGHPKGDEILIKVASVLKNGIRESDVLSRWGGEEFIILLPDTDCKQAYMIAERLRKTVSETNFDTPWNITCSIGTATIAAKQKETELIDAADKALYEAKHSGRNKAVSSTEVF